MNISPVSLFFFLPAPCYSHYARPSFTFLSSYLLAIHITPVLPLLYFPLILTSFSPKSNSTELLRCPSIQCTLTNTYIHTSNKHTQITQTHVHNSHTHTTHRSRGFGWYLLYCRHQGRHQILIFRYSVPTLSSTTVRHQSANGRIYFYFCSTCHFYYSLLVKSFFRLHLDQ